MKYLLLCCMLLLLAACSDSAWDEGRGTSGEDGDGCYVQLRIGLPRISRADVDETAAASGDTPYIYNGTSEASDRRQVVSGPTNGEDGDGREAGIESRENEIDDVTALIYTGDLNDRNSFQVLTGFYATQFYSESEYQYLTHRINVTNKRIDTFRGAKVLVFCNLGSNIWDLPVLNSLRTYTSVANDMPQTEDWYTRVHTTTTPTVYEYASGGTTPEQVGKMRMSSASEAQFLLGSGTYTDPVYASVSVQRMSARCDMLLLDPLSNSAITRRHDTAGDYDYYPFPVYNRKDKTVWGEYRLTHVQLVNDYQPETYLLKRVADDFAPSCTTPPAIAGYTLLGKETLDADGVPSNYVIDPLTAQKGTSPTSTWLSTLFSTTQVGDASLTTTILSHPVATQTHTCDEGECFIVGYPKENTCHQSVIGTQYNTGILLRAVFVPKVVYGAYDEIKDELTEDASYVPGQDFWSYMPTATLIEPSDILYFSSQEVLEAWLDVHHPGHTAASYSYYQGGVCYNYVFLRHANDDEGTYCPMEYATVRNNIYRISITYILGPGTPTTEAVEPEVLKSRIFVRPWNLRVHPEIVM